MKFAKNRTRDYELASHRPKRKSPRRSYSCRWRGKRRTSFVVNGNC
ncbi:MAG: hypothetical protein Ct9H300mP32_6300 [Verrucomicrobiota bacterium]|nr:MAG: hypothetical protein Ct9H300mP32_6300 [Verrucomicrobiota bacterium]